MDCESLYVDKAIGVVYAPVCENGLVIRMEIATSEQIENFILLLQQIQAEMSVPNLPIVPLSRQ